MYELVKQPPVKHGTGFVLGDQVNWVCDQKAARGEFHMVIAVDCTNFPIGTTILLPVGTLSSWFKLLR